MGNRLTMGNFFSGSGAWELAAKICGIDVLFESEIEPFPVALEAKRFPEAIQLGDVSKVNGAEIPPVDILTNSSPCQDLSVAGKRAGLDGERSGLFMEVIRITKEMRNADRLRSGRTTEYLRPRFWCWENVPGALSSAGGEDFKTVIEEVIGIVEPECNVPMPKKWSKSGIVDGDNWQLAWRIMDAQFYGVAQRRRRLYLVLDTFGHRAGEILFERESVSWNFAEIAQAWQRTSLSFEERIDIASRIVNGELRTDSRTLEVAESGIDSGDDSEVFGMNEPVCFDGSNVTNPINASNPKPGDPCHTLSQDSRNYVVEKTDNPSPVRQSSGGLKSNGTGRQLSDVEFTDGDRGGECSNSGKSHGWSSQMTRMGYFIPLHEPAPPLDASYYKGCGERNGIERQIIAVRRRKN